MKKTYWQCQFLYFFVNITSNLAQILPQDHNHFDFFCSLPTKYIKRFINNLKWIESSSSEKFLLKPLKFTICWPNFCKNRAPWATPKTRNNFFFSKITKPDHKLSKAFYFIKISYSIHMFWQSYKCFSYSV